MVSSPKKPAIVLVHGYRGSPLGLKDLASALGGYDVYTPAIPPYGGAGELPAYTPTNYADYLAKWIRRMKLEKPIFVGHSMGSIVIAALAEKHPDLINDKIIFLAPIAKRAPRFITNLAPLATFLPNRLVSYITTKYLFIPKKSPELFQKSLALTIACAADCDSKSGSRAAAKFSSSYCVSDFNFKKTALFLAGAKDRMNSESGVRATAKKYHAQVEFLPGCGHILNYECPERVAKSIIKFIESKN